MHDLLADIHTRTYDMLAEEYDRRVETYRAVTTRALAPFVQHLPANAKLLDIGCAVGYVVEILRTQGFDAEGIDISPNMIAYARRRCPDARFITGDFFEHLFDAESFDGVVLYAFIHLFPKNIAEQYLNKILSILKPGGFIFVGTTKSDVSSEGFEEKHDYGSSHRRFRKRWTPLEIEAWFLKHNLSIIHYEDNTDEFGKVWMDYVLQKVSS